MSSSNHHHYDQNLLNAAPVATRAQRQQGYNVDLLNQSRPLQSEKVTPTVLTPRGTDVETAVHEKYGTIGASHTPFFQSTKGRIAIFIAAIVIIGAVVGGAVGGRPHPKKHNQVVQSSGSTSSSTGNSVSSMLTTSLPPEGNTSTSIPYSASGSHNDTGPKTTRTTSQSLMPTPSPSSSLSSQVTGNNMNPSTTPPSNIRRR